MQINGLIKTTLLDYPGHLACTIFMGSCNFRCPFCHNKNLVLYPEMETIISQESILEYLNKRKNILEGVCISGGEPTLQPDLKNFISQIKKLGYKVKLDTNGYRPDIIKDLYSNHLIDYIAMDIKSTKENYPIVSGIPNIDISILEESIDYIMTSVNDYEFRTTVVKELHTPDDIKEIRNWIKGCNYYRLQSYKDSESVISPGFTSYSDEDFKSLEVNNVF